MENLQPDFRFHHLELRQMFAENKKMEQFFVSLFLYLLFLSLFLCRPFENNENKDLLLETFSFYVFLFLFYFARLQSVAELSGYYETGNYFSPFLSFLLFSFLFSLFFFFLFTMSIITAVPKNNIARMLIYVCMYI